MEKSIKFKNVNKGDLFVYDQMVFMKTTKTLGVSQHESIKHRNFLNFKPDEIVKQRKPTK